MTDKQIGHKAFEKYFDEVAKRLAKEIMRQSSIPFKIRKSLSHQVSKPKTRKQLKSSLILKGNRI